MWVELRNDEIAKIIEAIGPGPIAEKFAAEPHADTEAFANAADFSSDYVHVPHDTFIQRTRNGAYVLAFLWVYNQDAGFYELTSDFDDFKLSVQLKARLEKLRQFRLTWFHPDKPNGIVGAVDGQFWAVEETPEGLTFYVGAEEQSPSRFPLWKRQIEWKAGRRRYKVSNEDYFRFIADSVQSYREYQDSWRRRMPPPAISSGRGTELIDK